MDMNPQYPEMMKSMVLSKRRLKEKRKQTVEYWMEERLPDIKRTYRMQMITLTIL
jgi:hypothetical protein